MGNYCVPLEVVYLLFFLVSSVPMLVSVHLLGQLPLPILWSSFHREDFPIDVSYCFGWVDALAWYWVGTVEESPCDFFGYNQCQQCL